MRSKKELYLKAKKIIRAKLGTQKKILRTRPFLHRKFFTPPPVISNGPSLTADRLGYSKYRPWPEFIFLVLTKEKRALGTRLALTFFFRTALSTSHAQMKKKMKATVTVTDPTETRKFCSSKGKVQQLLLLVSKGSLTP